TRSGTHEVLEHPAQLPTQTRRRLLRRQGRGPHAQPRHDPLNTGQPTKDRAFPCPPPQLDHYGTTFTDPNAMAQPCYVSPAKEYRKQMAGSFEATELPKPTQEAIPDWQEVETGFQDLRRDLEAALRKAAEAHEGKASEAAQASIKEILPRLDNAARAANNVKSSLELQGEHQNSTLLFTNYPRRGRSCPTAWICSSIRPRRAGLKTGGWMSSRSPAG